MRKTSNFKRIALIISLLSVLIISVLVIFAIKSRTEAPQDVKATAEYYLDNVVALNFENLESVLYFEPETKNWMEPIFTAMREDPPSSYRILKYKELNPEIYKLTFKYTSAKKKDEAYENYVVYIAGEWKYVINPRDVPKDIYTFQDYDNTIIVG